MMHLPTFLASPAPHASPAPLVLRALHPSDRDAILGIEASSFPRHAWTHHDLKAAQRSLNSLVVAARAGVVEGFLLYTLWGAKLEVLRLAVWPSRRRNGVARALLALVGHELNHRLPRAEAIVSERWDSAIRCLARCGWRAEPKLLRHAGDDGEDLIRFALQYDGP